MGLDNGIRVKRTEYTEAIPELKVYEDEFDLKYKSDFELCYWRKCWNIRNEILSYIGKRFSDEYQFPISIEDIDPIIQILQSYNKDNWIDSGGCIWEYDEMRPRLMEQIDALKQLKKLMQKYDLEVYFYDSY